jgi:hypothetical protein
MMHVRALLGVAALCATLSISAKAAFLDDGWGARPVGMGGAFSAIADDTNAPLFNPAGLTQVQWNEVSAMYARLFSGLTLYAGDDQVHLDQSYLAYVSKPTRFGSFGVSWANFNTTHLYREDTVSLSYAQSLGRFIPALENDLSVGANLKYLRRSISLDANTANDPVFSSGDNASGMTVDLGMLYKPEEGMLEGWRFALVGKNLTRPDVGFQAEDRVPLELRAGIAYQSAKLPWLVPDIDVVRRNGVTGIHGGLESWLFHEMLGLRAGANKEEASAGLSYYQRVGKNFGFRLDYGFTVPFYIEDSGGSHRVQGTIYF